MPGRLARDKKGAQEHGARLAFLDESGFSERPPVRTTWSPKGVTPVIRHHFNWKRINAFGVITCNPDGSDPDLLLSWQKESIDAESVARFLTELKKQTEGPLVLLWDGLPAHRSKVVKVHINAEQDWLTVRRLPAYAPELNPVEGLWSALKGKDLANFCSDTIEQVADRLDQGVDRIRSDESILRGFLAGSTLFDRNTLVTNSHEGL